MIESSAKPPEIKLSCTTLAVCSAYFLVDSSEHVQLDGQIPRNGLLVSRNFRHRALHSIAVGGQTSASYVDSSRCEYPLVMTKPDQKVLPLAQRYTPYL